MLLKSCANCGLPVVTGDVMVSDAVSVKVVEHSEANFIFITVVRLSLFEAEKPENLYYIGRRLRTLQL